MIIALTLDIPRVLWRGVRTVLVTPTGGNATRQHGAFFALCKSQVCFWLLLSAKIASAGCARYVQGFGLKTGSGSCSRYEHPAFLRLASAFVKLQEFRHDQSYSGLGSYQWYSPRIFP